jgi:DNA repair protein RecO (recombination protein O)
MTESAVYMQPAFILQQRNYRETSLIIDALTSDFGRISVLAKGVRTAKSKTAGQLQPFIPLAVSYIGKAELKILTDVERHTRLQNACSIHSIPGNTHQASYELKGLGLYCGFYINELVACFLHKYDPHPEVFGYYSDCLFCLTNCCSMEAALRLFELKLLEFAGYGLQLEYDSNDKPIETEKKYQYTIGQGPVEALDGQISGRTLLALSATELSDPLVLNEAKTLMRRVIDVHLQGKPLKSRAVINKIMVTTQQLKK